MTAEPSDPQPDLAALDRRLRAVEHRQDHELTQEIAATGEAVRLLHDGLRDVDRAVTRVSQRVDQVAAGQQDMARDLARHGPKLDQVEAEVATVARSQIEHGVALAGLAGKADGLAGDVGALRAEVGSHGEMLAEILRRLPGGPE
jgi:chromosome segregation ATPase